MSYQLDREFEGSHDTAGSSRGSPGKRSLTDRLQRKATDAASSASAAPPPKYVDPTLSDAAFVDQLLAMPVQCRGGDAAGPEAVHALAAQGTAGSGGALPFLDQIQAAFGHHDVTGVVAHTDGAAAAAATAIGATAYATGNHVAFAGTPDLHTAAHEAAHVVQQRAGVHLKGGVGEVGDIYERHADAVADRVVAGASAIDLLDGGIGDGPGAAGAVQRKAPTPDAADQADTGAGKTVHTDWVVDFMGTSEHARGKTGNVSKAEGKRLTGDVLTVEGMHVGPLDDRGHHFKHMGNALTYGAAKLGAYEHPVGDGVVQGRIQYAGLANVDVKVEWGTAPAAADAGKVKAASERAARYVTEHLSDPSDSAGGSFETIRARAAEEADKVLPDHDPKVVISFKRGSRFFALGPQNYKVDKPSTIAANITVPTTTHYTPWSVTEGEKRREIEGKATHEMTKVEVEKGSKEEKTTHDKQVVDASRDQQTVTSDKDRTKTSGDVKYTREQVSTFARDMTSVVHKVVSRGWGYFTDKWAVKHTSGTETSPEVEEKPAAEEESRSWLGRMWDGAKDFIGKHVVDKVKGVVKKALKSKIAKIVRGAEWWFIPLEWGIDWVADKVKGKLRADKTEDTKAPRPLDDIPVYTKMEYDHDSRWLHNWIKDVQDQVTVTRASTTETVNQVFQSHWEHEHDHSKTDLLATHTGVHKEVGVDRTTGSDQRVKVEKERGGDTLKATDQTKEKTVTYGGTRADVIAGDPVLEVHVMPK